MRLRSLLVDGPRSIGGRARARRLKLLAATFPDLPSYRVLDLGGTAYSWLDGPLRPKSVTLVNLVDDELAVRHERQSLPDWLVLIAGDACDPPSSVLDEDFDLVFSNSLIEHVGGPLRRKMMADVVRGRNARYWVQTPYRYFPIEPHWLFPLFQFLPLNARAWLSRRWPLVHTRATSWQESVHTALDTELLSLTEFRYLFPDAVIRKERMLGMTKSLVAIRH
jgi:hypothetical protein